MMIRQGWEGCQAQQSNKCRTLLGCYWLGQGCSSGGFECGADDEPNSFGEVDGWGRGIGADWKVFGWVGDAIRWGGRVWYWG